MGVRWGLFRSFCFNVAKSAQFLVFNEEVYTGFTKGALEITFLKKTHSKVLPGSVHPFV